MLRFLFIENEPTAGLAELTNFALVRSYRPTRCRAHQLDCRPVKGQGSNVCLSTKCRLASPGCLLTATSLIGLYQPAILVCSLISRCGVAADRRGSVRTIPEILATPGYTKETLVLALPYCLSILDRTTLLKATNANLCNNGVEDQLHTHVHPVVPTIGTCTRILFPRHAKDPSSPVKIKIVTDDNRF